MDQIDINAQREADIQKLFAAVDEFAAEMKARVQQKALEGYTGWDTIDAWRNRTPEERLYDVARELNLPYGWFLDTEHGRMLVDAANFALFGWYLLGHANEDGSNA